MVEKKGAFVDAEEVPGVAVLDGKAYGEAGGKLFPVAGVLRRGGGYIQVLDIPQVEERPSRKAAGGEVSYGGKGQERLLVGGRGERKNCYGAVCSARRADKRGV